MTNTTSPLTWDDSCRLGHDPIDEIHEEFVHIVAQLQTADDALLPDLMLSFLSHAQSHFGQENRWMEDTEFPARECHIDEHKAVLDSALDVQERLKKGDVAVCRAFAHSLAQWFPGHATHLDSALAHWLVKRRFGGKPVVIHRQNRI
jgi:hemerythrin